MAVGKGEDMEKREKTEEIGMQEIDEQTLCELREKAEKYDLAAADFERVRALAAQRDCSVGEFLSSIEKDTADRRIAELTDSCGGNHELAQRIFELESAAAGTERQDMQEVSELFPELTALSQLPKSVVEPSRLKGSTLLDESLRHLAHINRSNDKSAKSNRQAAESSIGSQRNAESGNYDPTSREFIKALWSR